MAELDLNELSTEELKKMANRIDTELERRRIEEIKKAAVLIKKMAADVGKTVDEVMAAGGQKKTKGEPKYYNPENPTQTWTGRGKRPNWVHQAIAEGKDLKDLEIR